MGNSCIQAKRRYIPQPGTVKRKNRLKTRFLNKYKRQGIVKGKNSESGQGGRHQKYSPRLKEGIEKCLLFQKAFQIKLWHSISCHMLEHCTVYLAHILLYTVKTLFKVIITASVSSSMNFYQNGQPTKQMQKQRLLIASGQI